MEVAEFLVVTCASSLTLAIIGVFKEVTILTLAVIIKGNEITFINFLSLLETARVFVIANHTVSM